MDRTTKCRRTVKDEEGGLIFRWRIRRASVRRTLAAVILSAGVFVAMAALFRVEGSRVSHRHREAARVTVLRPGSEASQRWLEWARQQSPFLDRWEPAVIGNLQARIDQLDAELLAGTQYQPLLGWPDERTPPLENPRLLDPTRPQLPDIRREMARVFATPSTEGHLATEASESLRARWGAPGSPVRALLGDPNPDDPAAIHPEDLIGLERRFRVSVNRQGMVETCQVLDPEEREIDDYLRRWLLQQRLLPSGDELVWGEIRIQMRAKAQRGEEEKGETP